MYCLFSNALAAMSNTHHPAVQPGSSLSTSKAVTCTLYQTPQKGRHVHPSHRNSQPSTARTHRTLSPSPNSNQILEPNLFHPSLFFLKIFSAARKSHQHHDRHPGCRPSIASAARILLLHILPSFPSFNYVLVDEFLLIKPRLPLV